MKKGQVIGDMIIVSSCRQSFVDEAAEPLDNRQNLGSYF